MNRTCVQSALLPPMKGLTLEKENEISWPILIFAVLCNQVVVGSTVAHIYVYGFDWYQMFWFSWGILWTVLGAYTILQKLKQKES